MRQIDYAVKCIQHALNKVEHDRFMPATLSLLISDYLIDLAISHANDDFGRFVAYLPHDAIRNALLNQMIPGDVRQEVLEYRKHHETLQIEKENHCAEQRIDEAGVCHKKQKEIALSIQTLIIGQEIVISPDDVDSALRSLGWRP